jgi:cell division protein FtsQ
VTRASPGSQVVIDPRMRSRRIAVQRDAGRRRLRRLTLVLGGVAVVLAAFVATQTPLLDVDRITVEGARRTTPADVRAAARIERGAPLLGVDVGRAASRVEELPWVDRAEVVRRWPGTIEIRVTERAPAAVVEIAKGRTALVDRGGRVLEVTATPPGGLAELRGVDGRIVEGGALDRRTRAALAVLDALQQRLPGAIVAVSTDLDAKLVDGGTVRFGTTHQLDDKVVATHTVLADVDTACLEVLDVRVPGSPALTRNQRCS